MTTLQKIENLNKIDQQEFDHITKILLESFLIKRSYTSNSFLSKKEELLDKFSAFLETYLELHFTNSKLTKLELINFIDKINMQKELLEMAKGDLKISDIKLAGSRLGKKSQSAFKKK
jgi:hypothetical protein